MWLQSHRRCTWSEKESCVDVVNLVCQSPCGGLLLHSQPAPLEPECLCAQPVGAHLGNSWSLFSPFASCIGFNLEMNGAWFFFSLVVVVDRGASLHSWLFPLKLLLLCSSTDVAALSSWDGKLACSSLVSLPQGFLLPCPLALKCFPLLLKNWFHSIPPFGLCCLGQVSISLSFHFGFHTSDMQSSPGAVCPLFPPSTT